MIPPAISFGWFWSTLLVPQCIITNDLVCDKELSRAHYKAFLTRSSLIPKLSASLKEFLQTTSVPSQTSQFLNKSPTILIGAVEFFKNLLWNVCVFCHPDFCTLCTNDLQSLVWLLPVKFRAAIFIVFSCFIYKPFWK